MSNLNFFLKYALILLLGGLFIYSANAEVKVMFSPNGGVQEEIIKNLNTAKKSIDVAMYSFSSKTLRNALKERAKSGVQVRLILNKSAFKPSQTSCDFCDEFENVGIDVRMVNLTMHHKFAIIDGPIKKKSQAKKATLLTGSGNWSNSSNQRYDEDFMVFKKDQDMVTAFQSEFNLMWDNSIDYFGKTSYRKSIKIIPSSDALALFTSDNLKVSKRKGRPSFRKKIRAGKDGIVGQEIIAWIESAEDNIKISTAHFRRPDIYQALINAANRGVRVYLLTDQQEFHGTYRLSKRKCLAGKVKNTKLDECLSKVSKNITVKYKMYSRYWNYKTALQMHAKYMVIDDEVVLTGSFNWSYTAELKNFENLVILGEFGADAYSKHFDKVFNLNKGSLSSIIESIQSIKSNGGSCTFPSISLKPREIWKVKRAFRGMNCTR